MEQLKVYDFEQAVEKIIEGFQLLNDNLLNATYHIYIHDDIDDIIEEFEDDIDELFEMDLFGLGIEEKETKIENSISRIMNIFELEQYLMGSLNALQLERGCKSSEDI